MEIDTLVNINQYDYAYKKYVLDGHNEIDHGIKDLVDAINSIDMLCTINSCQGALIPEEEEEHCPITYVDFFVLFHQYQIAHKLFVELMNTFGYKIRCTLDYEEDYDYIDNDTVEDNGTINLRFRLEMGDISSGADQHIDLQLYKAIVAEVKEFSKKVNK